MSDILERLHRNENGIYGPVPIFADAAAEIKRLRAENNSLRWQLTELGQRLQIALDDASEWERAARGET